MLSQQTTTQLTSNHNQVVGLRSAAGPNSIIDRASDGRDAVVLDDGAPVPTVEPGPRVGITRAVDWQRRWRAPWPPVTS